MPQTNPPIHPPPRSSQKKKAWFALTQIHSIRRWSRAKERTEIIFGTRSVQTEGRTYTDRPAGPGAWQGGSLQGWWAWTSLGVSRGPPEVVSEGGPRKRPRSQTGRRGAGRGASWTRTHPGTAGIWVARGGGLHPWAQGGGQQLRVEADDAGVGSGGRPSGLKRGGGPQLDPGLGEQPPGVWRTPYLLRRTPTQNFLRDLRRLRAFSHDVEAEATATQTTTGNLSGNNC